MGTAVKIVPENEAERMAAVRRYDVLDTPPNGAFDRITAIAARRFSVPISIISIVDHERIWFKSHHGLDVEQIGRDPGLCASAILGQEARILEDAAQDVSALTNPLVSGSFGLRFYAGVPLRTWDGYNLGTLCVIDRKPRRVVSGELDELKDLASVVMDQLELRLSARRAVGREKVMAREIEHRVMNSLQFVSSMLTLQGRTCGNPDVASHLTIAAERVASVARVHRHFQGDEISSGRASCLGYLNGLCADLCEVVQANVRVEGTDAAVDSKQIQSIGLIVNELVTNSAKQDSSNIVVALTLSAENALSLAVIDDGNGLPAGFDPATPTGGLGMRLVNALSQQLGGALVADRNPAGRGARFTVTFPLG